MRVRHRILRCALIGLWGVLLAGPLIFTSSLKAQATPSLKLIAPADGATVDGPVTVRVEHSGIVFDGTKIGMAPEPGVGHWHINIDGKYAGLAVSNVIEIPNDAVPTISAGQHTIMVNLHENNHAVTNPPVEQSFQINLSKDLTMQAARSTSPGMATTATAGGRTQIPHTARDDVDVTVIMFVAMECVLIGGMLLYVSRRRRNHAGRGR